MCIEIRHVLTFLRIFRTGEIGVVAEGDSLFTELENGVGQKRAGLLRMIGYCGLWCGPWVSWLLGAEGGGQAANPAEETVACLGCPLWINEAVGQ